MTRRPAVHYFELATRPVSEFDQKVLENAYLQRLWSKDLDELIKYNMARLDWHWIGEGPDPLAEVIGDAALDEWRANDPLCAEYAWYNVLLTYAQARARSQGWTSAIRTPETRACPLCDTTFREDELRWTTARRLSMKQLDFCESCTNSTLVRRDFETSGGSRTDSEREGEALRWVAKLAEVIERVPHKGFGFGLSDLHGLSTEKRLAVFKLLRCRDEEQLRRMQSGGKKWFDVLVQAGVLPDGARMAARGIQCRADDGHMCFSLGEKTIDDLLFRWGIPHVREPGYPGPTQMRGDFQVGEVFIEYFGLAGDAEYDAKTRKKKRILKKEGIPLIAIAPTDLAAGRHIAKLKKGLSGAGISVPNEG